MRRILAVVLVLLVGTTVNLVAVASPAAAATSVSLITTQVLDPGTSQHWWWNNATADAYHIGLQATPIDPDGLCHATVEQTWYERLASGEREFHFQFGNSRLSDRCQVKVYLAAFTAFRSSSFSELAPGGYSERVWNNALTDHVYLTAAVPAQPASGSCRIQTGWTYQAQPGGETEFVHSARNVGDQACATAVRMVRIPVTVAGRQGSAPPAGGSLTAYPARNQVPASLRGIVAGARPRAGTAACRVEATETSYMAPQFLSIRYTTVGPTECDQFSWTFASF